MFLIENRATLKTEPQRSASTRGDVRILVQRGGLSHGAGTAVRRLEPKRGAVLLQVDALGGGQRTEALLLVANLG